MAADLTSSRSLIDRAQDQLDALKAKVAAFLESDPWGAEIVRDKDGWVLRACIPEQPPEDWWMDVGELAGNARSALDHLVFQLAIDNGSKPDESRTQFPIFEVEEDYLRGKMRSNRERMLAGVASRDRKLIDDAQPYKRGCEAADHPLAMLRSLTDRHKHREQHVGAAFLWQFEVMHVFDDLAMGFRMGHIDNPNPVLDKQTIHSAYLTDQAKEKPPDYLVAKGLSPDAKPAPLRGMRIDSQPKFTVGFFGDRSFSLRNIEETVSYAEKIIARFERRITSKRPSARPPR